MQHNFFVSRRRASGARRLLHIAGALVSSSALRAAAQASRPISEQFSWGFNAGVRCSAFCVACC